MNNKLLKLALDAHLLNYVEHETPRHYFIDGHADLETVQEFAELIVQECGRVMEEKDSYYGEWMKTVINEHFGVNDGD